MEDTEMYIVSERPQQTAIPAYQYQPKEIQLIADIFFTFIIRDGP